MGTLHGTDGFEVIDFGQDTAKSRKRKTKKEGTKCPRVLRWVVFDTDDMGSDVTFVVKNIRIVFERESLDIRPEVGLVFDNTS